MVDVEVVDLSLLVLYLMAPVHVDLHTSLADVEPLVGLSLGLNPLQTEVALDLGNIEELELHNDKFN